MNQQITPNTQSSVVPPAATLNDVPALLSRIANALEKLAAKDSIVYNFPQVAPQTVPIPNPGPWTPTIPWSPSPIPGPNWSNQPYIITCNTEAGSFEGLKGPYHLMYA